MTVNNAKYTRSMDSPPRPLVAAWSSLSVSSQRLQSSGFMGQIFLILLGVFLPRSSLALFIWLTSWW